MRPQNRLPQRRLRHRSRQIRRPPRRRPIRPPPNLRRYLATIDSDSRSQICHSIDFVSWRIFMSFVAFRFGRPYSVTSYRWAPGLADESLLQIRTRNGLSWTSALPLTVATNIFMSRAPDAKVTTQKYFAALSPS